MGLTFARELVVASTQVYPPSPIPGGPTNLQERLYKKLGSNSFPFYLQMPRDAPASVALQQGQEETGRPCGVHWELRVFVGVSTEDQPHRRSCVRLLVRRLQYAPAKQGRQPMASCAKEFLLSPGKLHLQVTLDRQIYYHEEAIGMSVDVNNNSNKQVKRVKVCVMQVCHFSLGSSGHIRNTITSLESQDGCPVVPGASLSRTFYLKPSLRDAHGQGIAMDGRLKVEDTSLASTTLFTRPDQRKYLGVVVSYVVRVKLSLGTLAGDLVAEVPFTLMNPPPESYMGVGVRPQENVEEATRLVIEECRRMSISDRLMDAHKSQDSLDKHSLDTDNVQDSVNRGALNCFISQNSSDRSAMDSCTVQGSGDRDAKDLFQDDGSKGVRAFHAEGDEVFAKGPRGPTPPAEADNTE